MPGKVLDGPITIRGDLVVTGHINKGQDTAQSNNGSSLQVIQGVLQAVVTQPNTVPASGDVRMYGQNVTINSNVVPGGTDGYFQIDQYINGAWQHLFEIMPSTTGNANVLDLFISGRVFARDSLLSAPGRFFFKPAASPFGSSYIIGIAYGNGVFVAVGYNGTIARSTDGGATWGSLISNPFGSSIIASIAYGNGVFVAGTADGKIARSLDGGATWGSLISSPFGGSYLYSIAYGNGVFVAGSTIGKIARSLDGGATWGSLISNPFGSSNIVSIAYGNGVFVAGTADGKIARSLDGGATWGIKYGDSSTVTVLTANIYGIATNGAGCFVIVGYDSSNISIAYTDYVEAGAGIVASGSNSNGSYIQFADGTMEVYGHFTTGVLGVSEDIFPIQTLAAAFLGANIDGAASVRAGSAGGGITITICTNTSSSISLALHTHSTVVQAYGLSWHVIGKWK